MGKKIKLPDYALKILSVLLAVGMWVYVSYVESPKSEYWFENISVYYVNDSLKDKGMIRVTDTEVKSISVKVRGTRNAILGLTAADIIATVDLSNVNRTGKQNVSYSIRFPIDGFEIVDKTPYLISIDTEKLGAATFELSTSVSGTPQEGCEIGAITADVENVEVSGPENIVGEISNCNVTADIEGKRVLKNSPSEIQIIMNDGTVYNGNDLTLSNTHAILDVDTISEKEVAVTAIVENVGSMEISGTIVSPEKITLKGSTALLDTVEKVETEKVYVSEYNREITANLILPEGAEVKDNTKTVKVRTDFKE